MRIRLVPLCGLAAALLAAAEVPTFRLPGDVEPVQYEGELRLNSALTAFEASLRIHLQVRRPAAVLWLHARGLEITGAEITQGGAPAAARVEHSAGDFLGLRPVSSLEPGRASVTIRYRAATARSGSGLFRREYNGDAYLLTQFEPESARTVFPCFDEPRYKVPWRLAILAPRGVTAFFNAPLEAATAAPEGGSRFQFATTKPLPPYLVALAVGPFEAVTARPAGRKKTPVRVLAPRGESAAASFAAGEIPGILEWFERFAGAAYPYEKLDFIAIPGCTSGAMEHPGLVTFCRPHLLAPPREDTPYRQRNFVRVAAHEIAHQWFGNLVTPRDWSDIWLGEGFANWLQGEYLNAAHPDWNYRAEELRARYQAMSFDLTGQARALNGPVESSDGVNAALGVIAYVKGAAVLRMFDQSLGRRFRAALRLYLARHKHGAASSGDLVAAVSAKAGPHAAAALGEYIRRPGVPLWNFTAECGASGSGGLRAEASGITGPVWLRLAGRATLLARLPARLDRDCGPALLLNPGGPAYALPEYRPEQLRAIFAAHWTTLAPAERTALLYDVLLLRARRKIPATLALELLAGRTAALDAAGLLAAVDLVREAAPLVAPEARAGFAAFVQTSFAATFPPLGAATRGTDTIPERQSRPALLGLLAANGHGDSIRASRELAERWLDSRSGVSSEMLPPVLAAAARDGDAALFDRMAQALAAAPAAAEANALAAALGWFRSPAEERRAVALAGGSEPWRRALLDTLLRADGDAPARIALLRARSLVLPPAERAELESAAARALADHCVPESATALRVWLEEIGRPAPPPPCLAEAASEGPALRQFLARFPGH